MIALLLCVPLLALQGGGLELPAGLKETEAATTAWTTLQDGKAESAAKAQAGAVLLEQLAVLEPADQLPFLMEAEGQGLLTMDLRVTYRSLAARWPALETRILETLVLPAGENDALLRGAIHAAGELATSNAALIEQLASLLDVAGFHNDARLALYALTYREFVDQKHFQEWWSGAKEVGRETWLEDAIASTDRRELLDWQRRLQNGGQPSEILEGLVHPRQQIRSIAYVALRGLDLAGLDEDTRSKVASALRNALQQESDAQLRIELLALVPQVLQGREALNPLLRALEFGVPAEREASARYLQLLEPEIAWEGIFRGLEGSYPAAIEGTSGPVPVRMALWSGLGTLVSRGPAPNPEALEHLMIAALAVENDRGVRNHIHSAVGRFGNPRFLAVLRPIVTDVEASEADRSDALVAMTRIVASIEDPGQLQPLLTGLLADPKPLVRRRAIESMRRLRLPDGPKLLVVRLPLETELVLQKEILSTLADSPTPEVVDGLASFAPSAQLRESYGRALSAHVGNDFATLQRVHQIMAARDDVDFAFQVVRGFPGEGLDAAQAAELERLYARSISERLLVVGVDNGNSSFAEDAVGRLQKLRTAEPGDRTWSIYLVQLQLMRDKAPQALAIMEELAALPNVPDFGVSEKWALGLDTLRVAAAADLIAPGRQLLEALFAVGSVPDEMQFVAEQVLVSFPPPEPEPVLPPKTPGGEAPEEGTAETPEPPAPAEAGSEPKPEGAGADPGPTAGAGSEEPPKMVADPL